MNITPDGTVLPCHAAEAIPCLNVDKVAGRKMADIGFAFTAYRSMDWLPVLCQSCERRDIDLGGRRCWAMAVLKDASVPDPVC